MTDDWRSRVSWPTHAVRVDRGVFVPEAMTAVQQPLTPIRGNGGQEAGDTEFFVSRGYVHVIADVRRGRFHLPGAFQAYEGIQAPKKLMVMETQSVHGPMRP